MSSVHSQSSPRGKPRELHISKETDFQIISGRGRLPAKDVLDIVPRDGGLFVRFPRNVSREPAICEIEIRVNHSADGFHSILNLSPRCISQPLYITAKIPPRFRISEENELIEKLTQNADLLVESFPALSSPKGIGEILKWKIGELSNAYSVHADRLKGNLSLQRAKLPAVFNIEARRLLVEALAKAIERRGTMAIAV